MKKNNSKHLKELDPQVYSALRSEAQREHENLELIASENFVSQAVLEAQGSVMTNKYAEGYPNKRWYNGCLYIDEVEQLAIQRAKKLFGAEHVNVQPHSGTQANMAVFFAVLNIGDSVMAMDLACGGHLSHGHPKSFSGKYFKIISYGVDKNTEVINYAELLKLARRTKPKLILAGGSAYPRSIDFDKFREIADSVGAYLMVDMAHFAGLVVAGIQPSPVKVSEFVTTTTHKTLRGPRGGMILCKQKFAERIDTEVFPGIQGGPLMHVIAAKAVAFKEAMKPDFKTYQKQIVKNAKKLSQELARRGLRIVSGGTDTHLLLIDLRSKNITGKDAAQLLDRAGITTNKNQIPYDPKSPFLASGLRLGTPAVTTRGMKEPEMKIIAELITLVINKPRCEETLRVVRRQVRALTEKFPLYKSLRENNAD